MRIRASHVGSLVAAGAAVIATTGLGAATAGAASKTVVTVAYGSTYVFDTNQFAAKWWSGVAKQFDARYPHAVVKLVPIPGSYNDIITKLSLLYRSPATAPDVAQLPTAQIGEWSSTGYLLPLNGYLKSASWWRSFPKAVQGEGTFGGKTYAVDTGENTSGLFYNKVMFRKAGLPVPWHPKNWADILAAAKAIKAKVPGVIPLWLLAGTGSGTNGILQGAGNLIDGSVTPTIYDAKTHKWVVDSPGLRAVLNFYREVYSARLGANTSDLFSPNAVTAPLSLFASSKLAIAIGSNYYGGNWTKTINAPYWAGARKTMGVAFIPTQNGQKPGVASTLGGWDLAVYAKSAHPRLAFDLIQIMESQKNQVDAANWAGFVPPDVKYGTAPAYANFAPPYQTFFSKVLPYATITPSQAAYTIWGQGFNEATGAIAQNPKTTVAQAIQLMKGYITGQLGANHVETLR